MYRQDEAETELIDLTQCSLDELRSLDDDMLELATQRVLGQVEKPRLNLGASGPPGRAD